MLPLRQTQGSLRSTAQHDILLCLEQPAMPEGALKRRLHLHFAEFGDGEVEVLFLSLDGRGKGEGVARAANSASITPSTLVRASLFQKRNTR